MVATLFFGVRRRQIKAHGRKRTPEFKMILLLLLLLIMSSGTHGHTFCTAVSTEQDTTVTCLFGKDISGQGFSVHVFSTPRSEGVQVLACNRQPSGGMICDKRRDTKFDENQGVTNQLILTRPPSNNTQGVQYQCEIVPSENDRVQRCDLIYKAIPSVTPKTVTTKTEEGKDLLIVAVLVLLILCIIAVTTIGVTWCMKLKRSKRRAGSINARWPGAAEEPEEIPLNSPSDLEESRFTVALSNRQILQGLPKVFYKLGWDDALEDRKKDSGASPKVQPEEREESEPPRTQVTRSRVKNEGKTKQKSEDCTVM